MNQVVAADAEGIAVAGDDPDVQVRIGELDPGGDSRRASVNGVESVRGHVVGKTGRAADARHKDGVFSPHSQLRQRALNAFQDRIVSATGTPANLLIGSEILRGQLAGSGPCHDASPIRVRIASRISLTLNGLPDTLFKPSASIA